MTCCYALYASDRPGEIRYVGSTVSLLPIKLKSHLCELGHGNPGRKVRWMKEVIARGAAVRIRVLSRHKSKNELPIAERAWIDYLAQDCDLLNRLAATWRPGAEYPDYLRLGKGDRWKKALEARRRDREALDARSAWRVIGEAAATVNKQAKSNENAQT